MTYFGERESQVRSAQNQKSILSELSLPGSVVHSCNSLDLPHSLPFDAWAEIGNQLSYAASASAWWLGDWLVYGEARFPDRYKQAIEGTFLNYQTLRNYSWVARNFEPSRRRDKLSFQHHAEVASLDESEQEIWLDRAEKFGWSRSKLRSYLRINRRNSSIISHDPSDLTPRELVTLSMSVDRNQENRWQEAAAQSNQSLDDWITSVLDQVAETLLHAPGISSGDRRNLVIQAASTQESSR